ncbi:DNA-3-methyladenine glycosylase I [Haematobacter massiliensis]|uniref:DNA-3-methyladenine glycosylase I n=1 Tax=Haematobacter massiliensis TaxID=195105 RepID=UPI0005524AB1|nr:DNA-3-methyladenine glycosylase I [Haematobacter massiliensis]OWJ70469.1 DNA-3-methyladenine glycosylase I [Haematobacter massiliensis]OWJ87391.1 DNA-3-methyladenine glycosylase I [Haematobacter massiliensis]QBJ24843.1 DNA-3-methyladenine glycosylase I [Haematobacter massiliensis]
MSVETSPARCGWCGADPLYVAYHDTEWGVPLRDGRALWELLQLEGFQAGLSWITILRKREAFRRAFAGFDPAVVAGWGEAEVARLLGDAGIVRHRGKIEATIGNARAFLDLGGAEPFADLVWRHAPQDHAPPRTMAQVPPKTADSIALSKALSRAGFRFCGPTTAYAFMQSAGLVNDHVAACFRQRIIAETGSAPR